MNDKIEKPTNKAYKMIGALLALVIGFGALVGLYMHFESTYRYTKPNQSILPQIKTFTSNNSLSVSTQPEAPAKSPVTTIIDCNSIYKAYYLLRIKADQGKDFSEELQDLAKHQNSSSTEFNTLITELSSLSSQNTADSYFKPAFTNMIRDIYRYKEQKSVHNYLQKFWDNLLFIRPIGNRAINKGGFDSDIALTEKAFADRDLNLALTYINNLPTHFDALLDLKLKLQARVTIKQDLEKLDIIIKQGGF